MKKRELKMMIREEIMNYLKSKSTIREDVNDIQLLKMIKPSFPSVVFINTRKKYWRDLEFDVISTKELSDNDIKKIQELAGYPPNPYGGPSNIRQYITRSGHYEYIWNCSASSD